MIKAGAVPVKALGLINGALLVARREIKDQLRDWRILTPIILLTLFFPLLMNFTAQRAVAFVSEYGAPLIGERLIPFLLMVVGFFPISISLVIALESFAGERERLSLEPLLATPLLDVQLYLGKMLASLVAPLAAAYLGIGVYLAGLMLRLGWFPSTQLLLQVLLLTTAQAIVMVSGAVVISSQTTSVRAANLLASFIIVPVSQLVIGESLAMFWGLYSVLWWIVFALIVIAALLGRMGLHLFNREELLGREIDIVDLKLAWSTFHAAFLRNAATLKDWYVGLLAQLKTHLLLPVGLTGGLMLVGYFVGMRLATDFRLPPEMLDFSRLGSGLQKQLADFGLLSGRGMIWVLATNLRALAIASLAGAFSLGVLAMILLMAPVAIIGYFAGNLLLAGQPIGVFLAALVLPHAIFEVPAAMLAGGAVLHLGMTTIHPPHGMSLGEGWIGAVATWARVMLGMVIPLIILAAAVEVFITPRIAIAMLSAP
jgi:uncharacterized membrane protein SpoIIM required for sporulation